MGHISKKKTKRLLFTHVTLESWSIFSWIFTGSYPYKPFPLTRLEQLVFISVISGIVSMIMGNLTGSTCVLRQTLGCRFSYFICVFSFLMAYFLCGLIFFPLQSSLTTLSAFFFLVEFLHNIKKQHSQPCAWHLRKEQYSQGEKWCMCTCGFLLDSAQARKNYDNMSLPCCVSVSRPSLSTMSKKEKWRPAPWT